MKELSIKSATTHLLDGLCILALLKDGVAILCDARNDDAIKSAFEISGEKEATLLCGNDAQINAVVQDVPSIAWDIIDASEKDITLILPKGINVSGKVLKPHGSIAIRWCLSENLRRLLGAYGKPLAAILLFRENDVRAADELDINESVLNNIEYLIPLATPATFAEPASIPVISLGLDGTVKIISE